MKKLLAVVLSAAMVLSMSTLAFAEGETTEDPAATDPATESTEDPATEDPTTEDPATEDPTTEDPATEDPTTEAPASDANVASLSLSVSGNVVTLNIDEAGWEVFPETSITWEGGAEATVGVADAFVLALAKGGQGVTISNPEADGVATGSFAPTATYTKTAGGGSDYTGAAYTLTFASDVKDLKITLTADGEAADTVVVGDTSATDTPETTAPTDSETPESGTPASSTPASSAPTTTTTTTTTTTGTGTSSTSSTTTAAKTADAAPVAAMAVLALAAAAVVVGMKKKVTE